MRERGEEGDFVGHALVLLEQREELPIAVLRHPLRHADAEGDERPFDAGLFASPPCPALPGSAECCVATFRPAPPALPRPAWLLPHHGRPTRRQTRTTRLALPKPIRWRRPFAKCGATWFGSWGIKGSISVSLGVYRIIRVPGHARVLPGSGCTHESSLHPVPRHMGLRLPHFPFDSPWPFGAFLKGESFHIHAGNGRA